jgi:NADPH-dependent ferric siderophore reductase
MSMETQRPAGGPPPGLDLREMMRRRGLKEWPLKVVSTAELTPRMRRVTLTADDLSGFEPRPGQDVVLMLPDADGTLGRRHYTVRSYDPASRLVDIDVVMHGDSTPATRWALGSIPGDEVQAFGPRGRNVLNEGADWRLFVGDETAIPGFFGMIEILPAGAKAQAIIEVQSDADCQEVSTAADLDLTWLFRGGARAEPSSPRLIEAIKRFEPPAGVGHVYLLGETSTVRAQRQHLVASGFPKDRIFAEGYWRPGRVGGHDHVDDQH